MKKYVKTLPLSLILMGLFLASSSGLSAQVVVHVPLGRFMPRFNPFIPRFYPPVPVYRPDPRFNYMPRDYRDERDYRRDYYEDRRDSYREWRDDYDDRRDSYDRRPDSYDDWREDYYDRRDSYNRRDDVEDQTYYDTRPRYDHYEENRNETLFKEYSAEGQYVRRIPRNAEKFKMAGKPFYMHEGIFYKPEKKGYIIIPPPIGLRVKHVPRGTRHLQIDGLDYYEINGTYYLDIPRKRYYEIVPEPIHDTRKYPVQPQAKDYRRKRK